MKKFINEHPKLYWFVVVTLAVVVFSIVTCVGCAKLEKAEAAESYDGVYYPNLWTEVNWGDYSDYKESVCNDNIHMIVVNARSSGGNVYTYALMQEPSFAYHHVNDMNNDYWLVNALAVVYVEDGALTGLDYGGMYTCSVYHTKGYNSGADVEVTVIGSTYDYRGDNDVLQTMSYCNISYGKHSYFINGPYAVIEDFENYNVFLQYPKGALDMSELTVYFKLGGQPMNPKNGYTLDYTLNIWLPSKEYWKEKYPLLMEHDFVQNVTLNQNYYDADVLEWQKKVGTDGNSVLYRLPLKFEFYNNPNTGESGSYRIQLDYKDILDYLEYALGDGETDYSFREYYGESESDWNGYSARFIFGHMVISRMDALVYTHIDDVDTYYGRTTTFTFLQNGNFVYSEVNKDALQNEDMESDIANGINQAIKDELIQTGDKVDELQQNINNASGSLGSFDTEFEGVDLWEGVKGVGTGLVGLTGFLGNIATVLGSVFVFLPYDVRQIAGYFFMASIVIALWKLIKR